MAVRQRAAPYLAGLGNGVHHYPHHRHPEPVRMADDDKIPPSGEEEDQDVNDDDYSKKNPHPRLRPNPHYDGAPRIPQSYAQQRHQQPAWNQQYYYSLDHTDPTGTTTPSFMGPWHIAALALLGALILLSALFLQLLAHDPTSSSSWHGKKTMIRPNRHLYKKKTDEWSDDEPEDGEDHADEGEYAGEGHRMAESELLSESVRGPGAYRRLESQDAADGLAMPSHHHHHHPYYYHPPPQQSRHRKVGTTATQQQAHNVPHQQQPYARNIYQAPSYRYPVPAAHRVPASPMIGHRPTVVAMGGPSLPDEPHTTSFSSGQVTPGSATASSSGHAQESGSISAMSSLGSDQPTATISSQQESPPPRRSSGRKASSPAVTIQEPLSATPETAPRDVLLPPPAATPSLLLEKTPRVRNRGRLVMGASPMPQPPEEEATIEETHTSEPIVMPFLPNLASGEPAAASEAGAANGNAKLPSPVNLQELQVLARLESGQTSSLEQTWSNMLLPPPRLDGPPSLRGQSAHFLEIQDSIDDSLSLDSNDPRRNIQHKRPDQLMYTDASASLQGAVNFDELELQQVIGGGGFGQVWKGVWNGTPVAVKVLTGSAQAHSVPRAILEEFAAEINLLKGMRHPNICLYMGACLAPPNRAIITELAAHGSLWDALRLPLSPPYVAADGVSYQAWPLELSAPDPRHGLPPGSHRIHVPPAGSWPWVLVKKVACGSARGMNYLHKGNPPVLHRDLKSANILLDESYTPKVCDFGLSRLKAKDRSMTGNCGTVQWMAPEVLANQAYNEKADVYSYGIILWELLTRECPYEDMTAIQCALAVLNRNLRPEIPRWCPPTLQVLIRSCLKKNPDERPSFTEILQILDKMP